MVFDSKITYTASNIESNHKPTLREKDEVALPVGIDIVGLHADGRLQVGERRAHKAQLAGEGAAPRQIEGARPGGEAARDLGHLALEQPHRLHVERVRLAREQLHRLVGGVGRGTGRVLLRLLVLLRRLAIERGRLLGGRGRERARLHHFAATHFFEK